MFNLARFRLSGLACRHDRSSGNDSRAFRRVEGKRTTVAAVRVVPRSAEVGDAGVSVGAITSTRAVVRARGNTIRSASSRGTVVVSNPSSFATIVAPGSDASISKVPSGPVVYEATTMVPSRSSTVTPGSGSPN